ncbi:MAG TPA: hypothetical protein VFB14_22180 [Bryobacteraceae bacterium]|jgi:hypothetical protein|nr:hypothetical protein [Bryobacteraceae bacterium]
MQKAGIEERTQTPGSRRARAFTTAGAILTVSTALIVPLVSLANNKPVDQSDNLFANWADNEVRTFSVDAALGVHYYQNSKHPAETRKNPLAFSEGDTFYQDGAVYPEGTIPPGSNTFDLNTPGAIGTYNVRGTWITDLAHFDLAVAHDASAPPEMAFATEILTFGDDGSAIMTDGMYPNAYFSARRVVLGGTGRFRGVTGEVEAENIGETAYGCNFRLKFKIRRAGHVDAGFR